MPALISTEQKRDRAEILDVLRGIAICGILLNNIYAFSGYGMLTDEMRQRYFSTFSFDQALNFLQIVFVQGKFYSLFSLLFGIGFSIILVNNEQKGVNGMKVFYRRMFILLLIGAFHLIFLWEGDILVLYALIGFMLPLFRQCSDKSLLIWAVVLILLPILIDVIKILSQWSPGGFLLSIGESMDVKTGMGKNEAWRNWLFTEGSGWQELRTWQMSGPVWRYQYILDSNRIPKVMGMFLIGFYVGRKKIYANLEQHILLFKKIRLWGFVIGIPASIAMAWFEGDRKLVYADAWGLLDTITYALSVVPLALAYTSSVCLLWLQSKSSSRMKMFAPIGRMALTNYVMQSVIGIILFYNIGFGFGQEFGLSYIFLVAVAINLIQMFYTHLWFRYFQFGPLEWIWRQLTYGKRLPLRSRRT